MRNSIGKLSSLVKRGKGIKKGKIKLPIATLLLAMLVVGGGLAYKAWAETQQTVSVSPGAVDVGQTTNLEFTVNSNGWDSLISIQIDYFSTEFSDPTDIICPADFKTKIIDKANGLVKCAMGVGVPINSGTVILQGVSSQNIGNQGFSIETIDVNGDGSSLSALVTVKNLSATAVVDLATTDTEQTRIYNFTVTNNGGSDSDAIKEININVPTGFTDVSVANPAGWTCSYTSPTITCTADLGSELINGSSLLVNITATAPATTGATTWNVGVMGSLGGGMNPTTQPTITVQTPPNIEEVTTTITPVTVSQGQAGVSFSVNVENTGEVDVTLNTDSTISFTDGAIIYSANLSGDTTIAGNNGTATLTFVATNIATNMIAQNYNPVLTLSGTDANTAVFSQTIDTTSNTITVQTPASLSIGNITSNLPAISKQSGAVNTAIISIPATNSGQATADALNKTLVIKDAGGTTDISGQFTISEKTLIVSSIDGEVTQTLVWEIIAGTNTTYEGIAQVGVFVSYNDTNTGLAGLNSPVAGSNVNIFTVDNTSPSITNTAIIPASPINTNTPTITFDISDGGIGINWSTVKINGAVVACSSPGDVYSCSHTFSALADNTYTFTISASDNVGNSASDNSLTDYVIDTQDPTTTDDYGTKSGVWQNASQIITLTPSDPTPNSGHAWTKYCLGVDCDPAGGTDYNNTPVTISDEGTTYFRYASADLAGNVQDTVSRVVMIDKQAPVAGISGAPTGWTNVTQIASVTCEDVLSGCNTESYKLHISTSGITACPSNVGSYTLSNPQQITQHSWVCSYVEDVAGNGDFSNTPVEFTVDQVSPTGLLADDMIDTIDALTIWQNSDATITLTSNDTGGSGVANSYLDVVAYGSACTPNTSYVEKTVTEHSTACWKVEDFAGNETIGSSVILVDKIDPTSEINSPDSESWQKENFSVSVSVGDAGGSGLNTCEYRIEVGGTGSWTTTKNWTTRNCSEAITLTVGSSADCNVQGKNMCKINTRATDQAENSNLVSPYKYRTFSIDWADSETTLVASPVSPNGSDSWYITQPTIDLTCDDGADGSGCAGIYYRWGDTGAYTLYNTTLTASEGVDTLYYYSIDVAGNEETAQSQIFKVDLTDPVVNAGDDVTTNALFTQYATVTDTDGSGVVTYAWTNKTTDGVGTIIFGTANNKDTTISVDPASADGTYTIRLTVIDSAGNTNFDEMTLVWDTADPTAEITSPTTDQVVKNTSGNVSLEFISTGGFTCEYRVDTGNYITLSNCASKKTITLADGRRSIVLKVTDEAENSVTSDAVSFVIDTDNTLNVPVDFITIQAAINAATIDDTINVVAGTYNENVNVNKSGLTLTGNSKTAVISVSSGNVVTVGANNITIENLTITGGVVGVYTQNHTGIVIQGNIIKNYNGQHAEGILVDGGSVNILENVIEANSDGVSNSTYSIDSIYTKGGATVTVTDNILRNNKFGPNAQNSDTGNWSTAAGLSVHEGDDVTATGNEVYNNDFGIHAKGGVESNTNPIVIAHTNKIYNNGQGFFYEVQTGGAPGSDYDATANWWNSASGPTHSSNAGGTGDAVSDNVNFRPWCTDKECNPIDDTAPTVTISTIASDLTNTSPIPVTVKFTEAVTNFEVGDIVVTNGTAGDFNSSGDSYSFNITPTVTEGTITVNIAAGVAWDLAGNYNTVASQFSIDYDSVVPILTSVSIASNNDDTTLAKIGDTVTLSFTSSEEIQEPTVTIAGHSVNATDKGSNNWTATYEMTENDTEGVVVFTIGFTDLAENPGLLVEATTDGLSVVFDKTPPTTSLAIAPEAPDGVNDWYITAPTLTLTCTDNLSGCDKTYYKWDDGVDNEYSGAITAPEGVHTLSYYSTDNAGNQEETETSDELKIDITDPTVNIGGPYEGQILEGGTTIYPMTWTAADINFGPEPIKLEYSTDDGDHWTTIEDNVSNNAGDNEYLWTVPKLNKQECQIQITAVDLAGNESQVVSGNFIISYSIAVDNASPVVTLNSPNGGEDLEAGSDYVITWTANDDTTLANDLVVGLEYSLDGSVAWNSIIENTENDSVYIWTTPAGVNSDNCLVRVTVEDASNNINSDISNSVFSIAEPIVAPESICTDSGNGQWTCDIELTTGWNLISSPVVINENIKTALSGITGNADIIQYYNSGTWLYYDPDTATENTLTTFEDGKGYWVYMNSSDTLTLTGLADPAVNEGSLIPSTYNINSNDWNLIGFRSVNDMIVSDYINSYTNSSASDYIMWKFNNGTSLEYLSKTDKMKPGYGYWFREK